MNHPIQLSTERLILRKPQATDVSAIIKHINNPKIAEMTANIPYPYTEDGAIFWINMANQGLKNKDKYVFAIVHNPASGSVMTKNGMEKEGILKQHIRKGDTYFDLIQYGILHPSLR